MLKAISAEDIMKALLAAAIAVIGTQAGATTFTVEGTGYFDRFTATFSARDWDRNGIITTNEVKSFFGFAGWGLGSPGQWSTRSGPLWEGSFFSVEYDWRNDTITYLEFGNSREWMCIDYDTGVEGGEYRPITTSTSIYYSDAGLEARSYGTPHGWEEWYSPICEDYTEPESTAYFSPDDEQIFTSHGGSPAVPAPATFPLLISAAALGIAARRRRSYGA